MSERKNINNLFQEKFENFEITPDEIVWENIEAKLKEKKKRRVIPFWWKLSGIAAALLIGLSIYNFGFSTNSNRLFDDENTITNSENSLTNETNKVSNKNQNVVNSDENNIKSKAGISNLKNQNSEIKSNSIDSKNNESTNTKIATSGINKNDEKKNNSKNHNLNNIKVNNLKTERVVFESSKKKKQEKIESNNTVNNNIIAIENSEKKEEKAVEKINSISSTPNENKGVVNNSINEKTNEINRKIDSAKIAIVEPNALEELLKEKEKKTITEPKLNRWQVSSNVAPIYFSSLSSGSPLDPSLENNKKTYSANNISYGLGADYTLNKKIKIRTGVNIINLDYDTNGIVYYQSNSVTGKIENLNPNINGLQITIESLNNINSSFNKFIQKSEGSLNQKFGYIEMPLEVTYKVLDKKFGIDFIGGMSTMVLNKNEIYLKSSEFNLKIGEANNLNNVHFSGNVGVGFKYNFFKNIEARIEPVFKYQINTFSREAGNFNPFVFGIYSGLNFNF